MRNKVILFLGVAMLVLGIAPAINLCHRIKENSTAKPWWSRENLYNIDFSLPCLNKVLCACSISTKPGQVVIGKKGWFHLGDDYGNGISASRCGATPADLEAIRQIGEASSAWAQWFRKRNITYKVIVCPNKETIYPESLPRWAVPTATTRTDMLFSHVGKENYVDLRAALSADKNQYAAPLFYKTDSHWNSLGAWSAYREIAKVIGWSEGELKWLSKEQFIVGEIQKIEAGDLVRFLRLNDAFDDKNPLIKLKTDPPVTTELYDFDSGHLIRPEAVPNIGILQHPLLTKSQHALNQKKILWIHDSFGVHLFPFMVATFSETLQLHYLYADPALMERLVAAFKPDYVFISVVERDSLADRFRQLPSP